MANVMFKQGSYKALQAVKGKATEGTFYVTTDEGGLYLGLADKSLKKIAGSILYFNDLDEFTKKVAPPYSTDALYFIAESNALVRYDGTKWVILNETPDSLNAALEEIKGNVAKNATAIAGLKTDKLDKTAFDSFKTDNDTALSGITDRLTATEGVANGASTKATKNAEDITAIKSDITALQGADTHFLKKDEDDTLSGTVTVAAGESILLTTTPDADSDDKTVVNKAYVAGVKTVIDTSISDVEKKVTKNTNDIATANGRIDAANTNITTLQSDKADKANPTFTGTVTLPTSEPKQDLEAASKGYVDTTVKKVTGDLSGASEKITALEGRMDTAESDIATLQEKDKAHDTSIAANAAAAKKAQETAESKATLDEVKALGYDTVTSVNGKISALKGTSDDASTAETVWGAKNAAKAADSKADAAATAAQAAQTTADAALPKAGGTMTGSIAMSNKSITGLAAPVADGDAANKKYVDDEIAAKLKAADAMTFKGVVDATHALPATGVQKGDTYKVGASGTYAGVDAKVGDLFINQGEDDATPDWVHVTSGYEDDYLQKLAVNGSTVYLTDGVNTDLAHAQGKFTVQADTASSVTVKVDAATSTITVGMEWGSF